MALAIGIDGAKSHWIAILVDDHGFVGSLLAPTLAEIVAAHPNVHAIAIDVPLGLPERTDRPADRLARDFIGARRSSVFAVPPREVLEAPSYAEANARSRQLVGRGLSAQSYAIRDKILEAEGLLGDPRVFEVHPEVCFRAMKGRPLHASKKAWNGLGERLGLLAAAGIHLPPELPYRAVATDDVIDAAAAAWSGLRIARGTAEAFPAAPRALSTPAERLERIWY